ncbi:saccharopine dehydrogenase NADP-binding domain-containing protein [Streptomyces sp. NPDC003327]
METERATGGAAEVAVYGAYGHTGRFVVAELLDRGYVPVLTGRDADRLRALAASHPGLAVRPATVDDPDALDRALAGTVAVINCAGPFATTAAPLVEAALRARIPYVDVAAEIEANLDTFARFADRARAAHTVVLPAMAFYGGLGDLLVTAAMGDDRTSADEAHIAYGLNSWHPTAGTRAAGAVSRQRRDGRRVRYSGGRLDYRDDAPPVLDWTFPEPMGERAVIGEFSMADIVTVPSHLAIPEVRTYMTLEAAKDLAAEDTPPPTAADDSGRSDQTFVVEAVVRCGADGADGADGVGGADRGADRADRGAGRSDERRAVARGRDIYAVSAPLAVEAVHRILTGRTRTTGVASAGALFDAPSFLRALAPHITVDLPRQPTEPTP